MSLPLALEMFRRGRSMMRIGEAAPLSSGGGFFHSPDEEDAATPVAECCFELEDGSGTIQPEDGTGCIQPESCP